jgi:HAD superfamily hydrolase (TIGR01509 family)
MTSVSAGRNLAALRQARVILLDFDGPVCAVFAGVGAATIAAHLRASLDAAGYPTDGIDDLGPHGVLAYAATLDQNAAQLVETELAAAELDAIETAAPTPGASAFLAACAETRRPVVMASNNNGEAIAAYLDRHQLRQLVAHIEGRDPNDARRMKPNPWVIRRALAHAAAPPSEAVLIGDAVTDMEAAHAADLPVVGYANKPGKAAELQAAGADAVATDMQELTSAIRAAGRPI